ncbi:MAG: ribonuclease HII [Bacillota bacterium]
MMSGKDTVEKIRKHLDSLTEEEQIEYIKSLYDDERKTIKEIVEKYQLKLAKKSAEEQRLLNLWKLEENLYQLGYTNVVGVDEAGRGPLAGPVVAGAVILPPYCFIEGLNDSKMVTEKKRSQIAIEIKNKAVAWAIGIVDSTTIEKINILEATRYAMVLAVNSLKTPPQYAMVDGMENPLLNIPQSGIVKGDGLSASIAAASIIAKTYRDKLMDIYDSLYPGYEFALNKGYGTQQHLVALAEKGACPIHRKTYAPIKLIASSN